MTWVEQMNAKHERLPTNLLVLVFRSDFTTEARRVATLAKIVTWTFEEMQEAARLGTIDNVMGASFAPGLNPIVPREYAFVSVSALVDAYKTVLAPLLRDRNLSDQSMLGVLMCTQESRSGAAGP